MTQPSSTPHGQAPMSFMVFLFALIGGISTIGFFLGLGDAMRAVGIRTSTALAAAPAPAPAAAPSTTVQITKVSDVPLDPLAEVWQQAPLTDVMMLPQMMAMPTVDQAAVVQVTVQAITDGNVVAFRLSWADAAPDMNVDADRFCDAVAIQLPLNPAAIPMMGNPGGRVQILHWKALWQKDLDEHFQDVKDLYPNSWADLYWFANPDKARDVLASLDTPAARQYLVAHTADNPMSTLDRKQPVEELIAEGFGSLTHQTDSVSVGRGVWRDGRWYTVFARPLTSDDANDYQFKPGAPGQIALAVWEGGASQVGGRKQWSSWTPFEFKP